MKLMSPPLETDQSVKLTHTVYNTGKAIITNINIVAGNGNIQTILRSMKRFNPEPPYQIKYGLGRFHKNAP